jgi:hypothetical protein
MKALAKPKHQPGEAMVMRALDNIKDAIRNDQDLSFELNGLQDTGTLRGTRKQTATPRKRRIEREQWEENKLTQR